MTGFNDAAAVVKAISGRSAEIKLAIPNFYDYGVIESANNINDKKMYTINKGNYVSTTRIFCSINEK